MRLLSSLFVCFCPFADGCTNILVTPGASADHTAMVAANDDSGRRHGLVTHFPAEDHAEGAMRPVWHFETGKFQGNIPQPKHTNNVISHGNDKGLVIGETTHGGKSMLDQNGKNQTTGNILDYGSLIHATLQRASTAREAVKTVAYLANTYGYASSMEGFSITDGEEVWYMELIGKGNWSAGIVWVALRVPDGYMTAHANQARIRTFLPCDDPNWCMSASDVVTFAAEHGLYKGALDDPSFSFSDVYSPVDVQGARFCEARVWYIFSQLADPADFDADAYLSYAQGFNLTNRMPLFVKARNVSRHDLHEMLSSHYENSWFDPARDVGAGAEHSPYRYNGLSWEHKGVAYANERVVGTQNTAWHYVASVQGPDVPPPMRAVMWFGSDDHTWAPKVPLYGGATTVDRTYDDMNCSARIACRREFGLPGNMVEFSWDSAYWVNSAVASQVYSRKDHAAPIVADARAKFDAWADARRSKAAEVASALFAAGNETGGIEVLTALAVEVTKEATSRWTALWQHLMITLVDGAMMVPKDDDLLCGCSKTSARHSDAWLAKVVADTGDHYRLPGKDCVYIDADGHCHQESRRFLPSSETVDADTIRKFEIPGVEV